MRQRGPAWRAVVAAVCLAAPARAAEVTLQEQEPRGSYRVSGRFEAAATADLAWLVLTDYDRMPEFVSALRISRILSREQDKVVIEQEGTGRFLFVSRAVRLKLAVSETRPTRIEFRGVDTAAFRRYEGSWTITRTSTGCAVSYELTAEPDPSLGPRFAARSVLRRDAARLLAQVRAEIERRAAGGPG